MADYLSTNTARLKVLQSGPRGQHHMQFRAATGIDQAAAITEVRSILTTMLPFLLDGASFISAEWAAEGSDIFLPAAWGSPLAPSSGIGLSGNDEYGRYVRFDGKSSTAARVSFTLFNVSRSSGTANNRLTGTEEGTVTNVVAALNGAAGVLCAIDQNTFFMKAYANTGLNDAVAKRSRIFA